MIGIGDLISVVDFISSRNKRRLTYEIANVEEAASAPLSIGRPPNSPFNRGDTALIRVTNTGRTALKREDINKLSIVSQGINVAGADHYNGIYQVGVLDVYGIGNIEAKKISNVEISVVFNMLNKKDSFFLVVNYFPVGGHATFTLRGVVADTKIVNGGKRKRRVFKELWDWLCSDTKSLENFLKDNPEISVR